MVDITIAVPTYNGASRLPLVLDKIKSQIQTDSISWEVIVVDNNSTDNTRILIEDLQQTWLKDVPLKYAFESAQGAAFARQKAIQVAEGAWIGFLDDDVLPEPDWLSKAWSFILDRPQMAAFGGQIHGEFESEPPQNFERIQSFLAIRERGNTPHLYKPDNLSLPPSAALMIRRTAWLETVPDRPILGGRTKQSMVQGDDYEPLLHLHKAGWEIWYNPAMHVHHVIPQKRLERDYLIALSQGCGLCIFPLLMINTMPWERPFILLKTTLGNLKRLFLHWLKHRHEVKTDVVAACEMAFFKSSLFSPIYFLKSST